MTAYISAIFPMDAPIPTHIPAKFGLVEVLPDSFVIVALNEAARDAMGELYKTTRSVVASDFAIVRLKKLTETDLYGKCGARFTHMSIDRFIHLSQPIQ